MLSNHISSSQLPVELPSLSFQALSNPSTQNPITTETKTKQIQLFQKLKDDCISQTHNFKNELNKLEASKVSAQFEEREQTIAKIISMLSSQNPEQPCTSITQWLDLITAGTSQANAIAQNVQSLSPMSSTLTSTIAPNPSISDLNYLEGCMEDIGLSPMSSTLTSTTAPNSSISDLNYLERYLEDVELSPMSSTLTSTTAPNSSISDLNYLERYLEDVELSPMSSTLTSTTAPNSSISDLNYLERYLEDVGLSPMSSTLTSTIAPNSSISDLNYLEGYMEDVEMVSGSSSPKPSERTSPPPSLTTRPPSKKKINLSKEKKLFILEIAEYAKKYPKNKKIAHLISTDLQTKDPSTKFTISQIRYALGLKVQRTLSSPNKAIINKLSDHLKVLLNGGNTITLEIIDTLQKEFGNKIPLYDISREYFALIGIIGNKPTVDSQTSCGNPPSDPQSLFLKIAEYTRELGSTAFLSTLHDKIKKEYPNSECYWYGRLRRLIGTKQPGTDAVSTARPDRQTEKNISTRLRELLNGKEQIDIEIINTLKKEFNQNAIWTIAQEYFILKGVIRREQLYYNRKINKSH